MITGPNRLPLIVAMLATFFPLVGVHGTEIAPGGDLRAAIAQLRPGDTLEVVNGEDVFASAFRISATGTAEAPIVIRLTDSDFVTVSAKTLLMILRGSPEAEK